MEPAEHMASLEGESKQQLALGARVVMPIRRLCMVWQALCILVADDMLTLAYACDTYCHDVLEGEWQMDSWSSCEILRISVQGCIPEYQTLYTAGAAASSGSLHIRL